jgi:hypothetical protein
MAPEPGRLPGSTLSGQPRPGSGRAFADDVQAGAAKASAERTMGGVKRRAGAVTRDYERRPPIGQGRGDVVEEHGAIQVDHEVERPHACCGAGIGDLEPRARACFSDSPLDHLGRDVYAEDLGLLEPSRKPDGRGAGARPDIEDLPRDGIQSLNGVGEWSEVFLAVRPHPLVPARRGLLEEPSSRPAHETPRSGNTSDGFGHRPSRNPDGQRRKCFPTLRHTG